MLVRNTGWDRISAVVAIRFFGVGLAQVGFLESLDRLERPVLCIAGEAPRADGGADQVHGLVQTWDQGIGGDAVELAQDEPLGPAGRPGHSADQLG